jgi:hypothetical protein
MMHSRRDFARTLTIAAAALPLLDARAAEETPPKPSPLADAQTAVVKAEYGQHLTAAELEEIRKSFNESAPYLQKFREFKLTNGQEPDVTFSSLVKRW